MLASVLASLTAHARASGSSSPEPFAFFDPASSSWRTSQVSLLPDSDSSWPTWPKRGTTHRGRAFELPTSARLTAASASSSLLPTPSAYESTPTDDYVEEVQEHLTDPHSRLYLPGRKWHAQRTLSRIAPALLPTPTAGDGKAAGSRNLPGSNAHAGVSLTDVVQTGNSTTPRRLLPTPGARDGENSSEQGFRFYEGQGDNPTLLGAARRTTGTLRHSGSPGASTSPLSDDGKHCSPEQLPLLPTSEDG